MASCKLERELNAAFSDVISSTDGAVDFVCRMQQNQPAVAI